MRLRPIPLLFLAGTLLSALPPAAAQGGSANELVRRVIKNEERAVSAGPRYRYRLRTERADRTVVKEMVETSNGPVARLLSVNDRPLTPEQRAADDRRLDRLLRDPEEQRQRLQTQQNDEKRTRAIVKALPDAFLYDFDGNDVLNGSPVVRLRFKPNPAFDAPTRETLVLRGMEGTMWIEPKAERLVRLEAKLFEDVTFGWGILARLNKGGRFLAEQTRVGADHWQTTRMELDFTGRALLVKGIKVKSTQVASDFREVPAELTLAQGVELLRRPEGTVAEHATGTAPPQAR
jgi:hypothetical protein